MNGRPPLMKRIAFSLTLVALGGALSIGFSPPVSAQSGRATVAAYLGGRGLTVAVFYTSNVESYLFRSDDWRSFYTNVALLPVDRRSVLVRSK